MYVAIYGDLRALFVTRHKKRERVELQDRNLAPLLMIPGLLPGPDWLFSSPGPGVPPPERLAVLGNVIEHKTDFT